MPLGAICGGVGLGGGFLSISGRLQGGQKGGLLGVMEGLELLVAWALGLGGGMGVSSKGEARMRENLTALGSCGGEISGEELVRRVGIVGNDALLSRGLLRRDSITL